MFRIGGVIERPLIALQGYCLKKNRCAGWSDRASIRDSNPNQYQRFISRRWMGRPSQSPWTWRCCHGNRRGRPISMKSMLNVQDVAPAYRAIFMQQPSGWIKSVCQVRWNEICLGSMATCRRPVNVPVKSKLPKYRMDQRRKWWGVS